jgi:hypothetical protein
VPACVVAKTNTCLSFVCGVRPADSWGLGPFLAEAGGGCVRMRRAGRRCLGFRVSCARAPMPAGGVFRHRGGQARGRGCDGGLSNWAAALPADAHQVHARMRRDANACHHLHQKVRGAAATGWRPDSLSVCLAVVDAPLAGCKVVLGDLAWMAGSLGRRIVSRLLLVGGPFPALGAV